MRRRWLKIMALAVALLIARMVWNAAAPPVERRLVVHEQAWPAGTPPMRLVLLSDFHVSSPGDTPRRLARTVARVNALHPDLVLLAGDFLSNDAWFVHSYPAQEAIAPLGKLRARDGVIAVMGNHDYHQPGAVRQAFRRVGIPLLSNQTVRFGPLALMAFDDPETDHADPRPVFADWRRAGGLPLVVAHGPDILPKLPRTVPQIVLVGHTHCGQVSPWPFGAIVTSSSVGRRYACGIVRDGKRATIITAGLGVSELPLRLNAPPDFWVIDIGR